MEPINYIIGARNTPFSYKDAFAIEEQRNTLQAQRQALLEKEALLQQQRQMQADLSKLASLEKPTLTDYTKFAATYPEQGKALMEVYNNLKKPQREDLLYKTSSAYHALEADRPDVALKILEAEKSALEDRGGEDLAAINQLITMVNNDKRAAQDFAGTLVAYLGSKDGRIDPSILKAQEDIRQSRVELPYTLDVKQSQATENIAKAGKAVEETKLLPQEQRSKEALRVAQISDYQSQILNRGLKYDLDKEKLYQDVLAKKEELAQKTKTPLSSSAEGVVNESVTLAAKNEQDVKYLEDLTSRFEKASFSAAGVPGKAAEAYKNTIGRQDTITQLRQEYDRVLNMGVIDMLPKGSASNYDVQIVRSGFPKSTDNPERIVQFLKSFANIKKAESKLNYMKSDWVSANGSLGTARNNIEIDGVMYKKGTTFRGFLNSVGSTTNNNMVTEQRNQPAFFRFGR